MDDVLSSAESGAYTREPLRFTGRGGEYFQIWIVNLLLTIVTFGIYSAWAKVRRLQYFYRHTELAGSTFDFHGNPVKILIGRIAALVMLGVYNYSVRLQSWLTIVVVALVAALLPWLLRNSLRFRLYNTSWRGARFHFRGSVGGAYRVFLLYGILSFLSLGMLVPFEHQRLKAYQHGNSWFGRAQFSFHAGVGKFYRAYLIILAGLVLFGVVVGMAGIGSVLGALLPQKAGGPVANPKAVLAAVGLLWGGGILIALAIGPLFHAMITNLIWSNTRLGPHRIECHVSTPRLMWITVSNFVLVVVTLGFFMPWAKVRMARFLIEAITLLPVSDLQEFVDSEPESIEAFGEETASIFDVDIAL